MVPETQKLLVELQEEFRKIMNSGPSWFIPILPNNARMPDIDVDDEFKLGQVVRKKGDLEEMVVCGIGSTDSIMVRHKDTDDSIGWILASYLEHVPGYQVGTMAKEPEDEKARMAKFFARSAHDR